LAGISGNSATGSALDLDGQCGSNSFRIIQSNATECSQLTVYTNLQEHAMEKINLVGVAAIAITSWGLARGAVRRVHPHIMSKYGYVDINKLACQRIYIT
jgi:hypothetical protein